MQSTLPLLSLIIWLPIASGCLLLAMGDKNSCLVKRLALAVGVVNLMLCLPLIQGFDASSYAMQFVEQHPWFPSLSIEYGLGVDGFAMPLIVLSCFMSIFVFIAGWSSIKTRVSQYYAAFLILEGLMCGVFAATDAILFYFFWEAMLIPMFLIIGIWGGPNRVYATIKFFLYTFLGSVLMLVALVYLHYAAHDSHIHQSFAISTFQQLPLALGTQKWLFFAFLAAFAVKVPMFPVHTWLPDAHVEAPTGGSVILAAILLKMGTYGFIRFLMPIVPDACREFEWLIIGLSLIAVVYISLVALVQQDMKRLIAYSSIAHMGFVTLGLFVALLLMNGSAGDQAMAAMGVQGAMMQMISHGFISGALFLCVGVLYDRMHSRMINDYGGVVNTMPWFAALFMLFAMANAGLPGTSGFVGEFLVILSTFKLSFWYAFFAATTLIAGAAYTLWMYKRVMFGKVGNDRVAALKDISVREGLMLAALALTVLYVGVHPAPVIDVMQTTTTHFLSQVSHSKFS